MAHTTLLVHLGSDTADLRRLTGGIDGQTLPYADFEVAFVVDSAQHPQRERLEELAARRPNVQVVVGADRLATLGTGEWLVYLSPQVTARRVQLNPRALEFLVRYVAGTDHDLVVARTDAAGHVHDLFASSAAGVRADALTGPFAVAYRRAFAEQQGIARDTTGADTVLSSTERRGVFGSYPFLADVERPKPVANRTLTIGEVSADWADGRLRARIQGSAPRAAELRVAVRHTDGEQFWVGEARPISADETFTCDVELDVRNAALGAPLQPGVWQLVLTCGSAGEGQWVAQQSIRAVRLRPAALDGTLIGRARGDVLGIDVAATSGSALPRFSPADAQIAETAAGTLLTVPLTGMYASGSAAIPGYLLLDKFKLPAVLATADGAAQLTCKLSGLAGTAELGTQFGAGRPAPTGLSLDISPTGQMSVVRTVKKPAAKKAAPGVSAGSPLLAKVRREVARNETARRIYRRFVKR